jgi:PTH1 family peptidyl-tRNA hydrolase
MIGIGAYGMAGLPIKLIAGLGNPGPEYTDTRHNAGFWCVDLLARRAGGNLRAQARYQGEAGRVRLAGQEVWLLKPTTFMNRSGASIRALAEYLRIPVSEILVVHDELDLPCGAVRLKQGGGAGGHNGLKDTIAQVGEGFWRLRIGVGHPGNRDQVVDYVLRRASATEQQLLDDAVDAASDAVERVLVEGAEKVMNGLHRRKTEG